MQKDAFWAASPEAGDYSGNVLRLALVTASTPSSAVISEPGDSHLFQVFKVCFPKVSCQAISL